MSVHTATTVLIVDDEPSVRQALAKMLAKNGYRVLTAGTFEEGRQTMDAEQPDLLIVDVRLGDFNGLQLIASSPAPVRAIVLTGYADIALERDARQFGAEYLIKPVEPSELLAIVSRQLHAARHPPPVRRWTRHRLPIPWGISVNGASGRLLDFSGGGARFEVGNFGAGLPHTFTLSVPGMAEPIQLELVWKVQLQAETWLCGGELSDANESVRGAWRNFVDNAAKSA